MIRNVRFVPKVSYIVRHSGFNRQDRRHKPEVQMYIEEGIKEKVPIPHNNPYLKNRGVIKIK